MGIVLTLSTLALRQLIDGACNTVGAPAVSGAGDAVAGFLVQRFTDHSQRLTRALQNANDRAWRSLEIALAGDTLWERCKGVLAPREEQAFREQVQAFLLSTPFAALPQKKAEFCRQCLRELRAARQARLLTGGQLDPELLARHTRAFARFADPRGLVEAEWGAVKGMARLLAEQGYGQLASLLELRPGQGEPLLVVAARYFFRREVEGDEQLFRGLAWASWTNLAQAQQAGFDSLARALAEQGRHLESLLGEVRVVVEQTHADVLDVKTEVQRQGEQLRELGKAVLQALEQHQFSRREVRPQDSLSIRDDGERQLVKRLVARYRALPAEQRHQTPALLNALGKLELGTGEFAAAQQDFQTVARLVPDAKVQAEARYNAYRAALERREWAEAYRELLGAIAGDNKRFAPFPVARYKPRRILGAGGFGVAFLCEHAAMATQVVVKTLLVEGLEQDIDKVFGEARLLGQLNHPGIIRLWDCGYLEPNKRSRPYLVMDYFEGETLEDHVQLHGVLTPQDARHVALAAASALEAAHRQDILHRDVKPANLLVRPDETGWQVKLIDFGLALKQGLVPADGGRANADRSLVGSSIAGTQEYAAPEQMGRLPGVAVGPYSDVYGFGRTCYFALLGTPEPDDEERKKLSVGWRKLLGNCTARAVERRPAAFAEIQKRLARIRLTKSSRKAKRSVRAAGKRLPAGNSATAVGAPPPQQPAPGQASALQLLCPHCRKPLVIRAANAQRRFRCPLCQGDFVTPPPKG
jgi:hypothetical protein